MLRVQAIVCHVTHRRVVVAPRIRQKDHTDGRDEPRKASVTPMVKRMRNRRATPLPGRWHDLLATVRATRGTTTVVSPTLTAAVPYTANCFKL